MTSIQSIPIRLIDVGRNVRVDPGDIADLAASIRELGVLQPVKVTSNGQGRYRLVWGQRRTLAAREAGLLEIPAMVVPPDADLADHGARRAVEQLSENLQRAALNPIDTAAALRETLQANKGLTQGELGKRLGRSGAWVSFQLALLDMHQRVQEHVRDGRLSEGVARILARLPVNGQARTAAAAAKAGWTVRETEARVARILRPPAKRPSRGRPRIYEVEPTAERSRSVVIPIRVGNLRQQVTVGIDGQLVDLIVEDAAGQKVMLTLRADDARLLGRRLTQAWQAVAS